MRNRNILVLGIAVVLIAAVALLAAVIPEKRNLSADAPTLNAAPAATENPLPENTETPDEATADALPQAYLLVTVNGTIYEPIPLHSDGVYTLRQTDVEAENVIHVTPDSVYMESSSCDNQDCVLQGVVSLENMEQRVLGNMIICLPNEVTLELYTPEGLAALLMQTQPQ